MAKIRLLVQTNFDEAEKDLKSLGTVSEQEAKRMERGMKNLNKTSVDNFLQRQKRAAAAVTMTRGRMEGLSAANKQIERRMQALVRNGIDPQDAGLKKLQRQYKKNSAAIDRNSRRQERNTKIKRDAKVAVLAMGVATTLLIGKAVSLGNELATVGQEVELVNLNFNKFANDKGLNALTMMDQLRESTSGFVDDMTLQQNSIKAMASGIDFQDLTVAMEFVSKFALATGKNVAQLMSTTMDGLVRGSALKLDDIGIMVQGSADVTGDAIKQMREKMNQFADSSETAAARSKRFATEITNLKQEIGVELVPAQAKMLEIQKEFYSTISDNSTTLVALVTQSEALAKWLLDMGEGAANFIAQWTGADKIAGVMDSMSNPSRVKALQREIELLKDLYDQETKALLDSVTGHFGASEAAEEEAEKTRKLIEAKEKHIAFMAGAQGDYNKFIEALGLESTGIDSISAALDKKAKKVKDLEDEKKKTGGEKAPDFTAERSRGQAIAKARYEADLAEFERVGLAKRNLEESNVERSIAASEKKAAREHAIDLEKFKAWQDVEREKTRIILEQEQLKQQWIDTTFSVASSAIGMVDGLYQASSDRRLAEIERVHRAEVAAIKDSTMSEEQKNAAIIALDKKAAREKHKQAMADWRRSIAMIQINAAMAAMKVWADPGYPAAIPLTFAVGAQQTAATAIAVSNKPVPSAETGTSFTVPDAPGTTNRVDGVGLMVNAGENVEVTPRGEDNKKAMTVVVKLNERTLWKSMQDGIDASYITFTNDNLRG